MFSRRHAFTLIELSVVLVVIGLLIGGITVGRTMVRSGELKSVIVERAKYTNAVVAFREKYKALPGDMADAYDFWGTACGTNATTPATGCNGNGNGNILVVDGGENVKAWEHLYLAKLVDTAFTGGGTVNGSGVNLSLTNVMVAGLPGAVWDINSSAGGAPAMPGNLFIRLGAVAAGGQTTVTYVPLLTHGEARDLDRKMDDGAANTGRVQGDASGTCSDSGSDYYQIGAKGENFKGDCTLTFTMQ